MRTDWFSCACAAYSTGHWFDESLAGSFISQHASIAERASSDTALKRMAPTIAATTALKKKV
jgi:hypothetical protein